MIVEFSRESIAANKERLESELGHLALQQERLQQAQEAIEWHEELLETLERGGAGRNPYPYDSEGAWRLVETFDRDVPFELVISAAELPTGITPVRKVVEDSELATAACKHCEEQVPLIGKCTIESAGMGYVADNENIAVVHCERVQILSLDWVIPFRPHHISPQ